MALSGEFATALQKLLEKLQTDQAEIDFQEQVRRRLFANQEADINQAKPGALRQANQSLADRGLVQSGIGLGAHGNIDRSFMTNLANLGQGYGDDLAQFARNRLSNQSDYNWNFADLQRQWTAAEAAKAATGNLANPNPVAPPVTPPVTPAATTPVKPRVVAPSKPKPVVPKKVVPKAVVPKAVVPVKPVIPGSMSDKIIKKPVKKMPVIGARGGY
jgi:hypothetical protein